MREVGLCFMLRVAMADGVSLCRGHVVGEGASAGSSGEVRMFLPCFAFCLSACTIIGVVVMSTSCC